ncbi:MAG: hypothetical protein MJK15_00740 [Colwellia sp.]|nr:hypothetical protein [Colwellia sp.]
MSRIKLEMTIQDIVMAMCDGNPGAIAAMVDLYQQAEAVDPQAAFGGLTPLVALDTLEIYGTDIYILYSDKCQKNVRKMLLLLRAHQLGFVTSAKITAMAADQMREVDLTVEEWEEIDMKVCDQLEQFQKPEAK